MRTSTIQLKLGEEMQLYAYPCFPQEDRLV